MAEGAFRKLLRERGLESWFEVDSAGTRVQPEGEPMHINASTVLQREGAYFPHKTRGITQEDVGYYQYIVVMDRQNKDRVLEWFPEAEKKVRMVGYYLDGEDIPDPFGQPLEVYEQVYRTLERALVVFLNRVIEEEGLQRAPGLDGN